MFPNGWNVFLISSSVKPSSGSSDTRRIELELKDRSFRGRIDFTDGFVPLASLGFCAGKNPLSTASMFFCLLTSVPCTERCPPSSTAFFLSDLTDLLDVLSGLTDR